VLLFLLRREQRLQLMFFGEVLQFGILNCLNDLFSPVFVRHR